MDSATSAEEIIEIHGDHTIREAVERLTPGH